MYLILSVLSLSIGYHTNVSWGCGGGVTYPVLDIYSWIRVQVVTILVDKVR